MLKPVLVFGCLDQGEALGTGGSAAGRSGAIADLHQLEMRHYGNSKGLPSCHDHHLSCCPGTFHS